MRLGVIADIHGDIRALELTLKHLESHQIDAIVCLGDLVGYGSSPDAVVALIEQLDIPCVRGNHDRWALERKRLIGMHGWRPAKLKDSTWQFLERLPASRDLRVGPARVILHHGSPASDMEFVTPYKPLPESVTSFQEAQGEHVLLLGHTHIPMIDRSGDSLILNPGSVHGVPGIQTSYSFAILDLESTLVRIFDIRLGREIRRDPIYVEDEEESSGD